MSFNLIRRQNKNGHAPENGYEVKSLFNLLNVGAAASFRRHVLTASAWSLAGYAVSLVIRFGSNLLMTRLLSPQYFGLMAIATVILVGLAMVSDMGLRQNIVRSERGDEKRFLNTAWLMQILRGILLSALAVFLGFAASWTAGRTSVHDSVYSDPLFPQVISVLSLGALITGFISTKWLEASRNMLLRSITQIEIVSQLVGLACMLSLVYFDRTIWPLVVGSLTATLTRVVLSHVWLRGTNNSLDWDPDAAREIFSFGKWVFASSVLGFLASNADRLILGTLVDTTILGVYAIALLILSSLEQALTKIISDVSFPALSQIVREQPGKLQLTYYRIQNAIAGVAYFLAAFLFLSAPAMVGFLYDVRYEQAGVMLRILALSLLLLPLHITVQAFVALGRPNLFSHALLVRLLVLLGAMPLGFFVNGAIGAIWGALLAQLASSGIIVFNSYRLGLFNWRKELMPLVAIPAGCVFAFIVHRSISLFQG